VFVICAVQITGAALENGRYRAMQTGYRNLQQQSERCQNLTETAQITRPPGQRTATSPLIPHSLIRSTHPE
jgi:hypothetical protein